MKTILKIIGYLIGVIIFSLLSAIGFIYTLIKHIIKWDYSIKKQFLPIFKNLALIFDGFANATAGELLRDLLLKKKKNGEFYKGTYKYGKWHDTISAVTGVNEKRGKLNKLGKRFTAMLSFVLGNKHAIEAIVKDRNYE